MGNNGKDLISTEEMRAVLLRQQQRGTLLNIATENLTAAEKEQLKLKIIEERIKIDVSQANSDLKFSNSTRDISNTISAVNAIEMSSNSDYDVKAKFDTASGRTDIHIKKNNNTVIIVVCVVIGILVSMLVK